MSTMVSPPNGTVGEAVLGTDFVQVVCTHDDGNQNCTEWQITAGSGDKGRLFEHIPRMKKEPAFDDFVDDFNMPWNATVVTNWLRAHRFDPKRPRPAFPCLEERVTVSTAQFLTSAAVSRRTRSDNEAFRPAKTALAGG